MIWIGDGALALEAGPNSLDLSVGTMLDADEVVPGINERSDHFIELRLHGRGISIL